MESVGLGMAVVVLAAVMQGSFVVPMSYVRKWQWENSWSVFTVLGMGVFNWVFGLWAVPHVVEVHKAASAGALVPPIVFGLLWGIGAVCFGLGMAALGLALGYAIIMGLVLSVGALVPMLVFHPEEVGTFKGLLVWAGLVVMLAGISTLCAAGIRKDNEKAERQGKITKLSRVSVAVGLIICVFAGVLSSLTNVGYSLSGELIAKAEEMGASSQWAGSAAWTILFTFGGVANLIYCGYLFKKHGSFGAFKEATGRNVGLIALMSLMWIGSFILYGVGARLMGNWGTVIGWSVFIALSIGVAAVWGVLQGEWKKVSSAALKFAFVGIAILGIFAYGAYL